MTSAVRDFYKDQCVFITGATGFLGKVLLEKILRSCPELQRVYILIRPKRNEDVSTRIRNLFNRNIFSNLQQLNPSIFDKVVGISGDALQPNLGISIADKELLVNDVSVVFHIAASIRFNDTLKYATEMNVIGTMKVVELCKQMRKLKVMVHVSTAFSNCQRNEIKEEIYPVNLEPHRLLSLADWMEEHVLESISSKLVGDRITTYHMTKSITEKILEKESEYLPIVIVRPSVIIGAWQEPLPGYTETVYHINGILIAAGRGVLRVLHCDPNKIVDVVPVDFVANLLISVPFGKSLESKTTGLKLYNMVSGVERPLTYRQLRDYTVPVMRTKPLLYPLWYPSLTLVKCAYLAIMLRFIIHSLPALVVDRCLMLIGMKPRLGRVMRRIDKSQSFSEYFLLNDYQFSTDNVQSLWRSLPANDQEEFCFDISRLSWESYFEAYFLGCKEFVVKEDLSTIPRARNQMRVMKYLYYFLTWSFLLSSLYLILSYFDCTSTIYDLYNNNY